MGKRYFSNKIAKWYVNNKRSLPWRDTCDPYSIWLSEVILQQTRVNQGLPYYQQFLRTFPSVTDLANAPEQQVLRLWQGLGYYTRARNLHKCARTVVAEHGGKFPSDFVTLLTLPGIGEYTAAAIASFSFGERVAVVDGNVFRVLSRIFGIETPINSPEGKKIFSALANELISPSDPALHNQAIMEFGAMHCTPKNPNCHECPFRDSCIAYNKALVDVLPVKLKARKTRKRYFFYLVVERNKALLMKQRREKDIWHGLFDFILIEKKSPVKPENLIATHTPLLKEARPVYVSKPYKHLLTHQTIHCRFIHLQAPGNFSLPEKEFAFYTPEEVAELPKPVLISRFLDEQIRD